MRIAFTLFAVITVGTITLEGGIGAGDKGNLDYQQDYQYSFDSLFKIHNYIAGIDRRDAFQKVDVALMQKRDRRTDSAFYALKIAE